MDNKLAQAAIKATSPALGQPITGPDRGTPTTVAAPEAPLAKLGLRQSEQGANLAKVDIEANDSKAMSRDEVVAAVGEVNNKPKSNGSIPKWLRDDVPFYGTILASLMHLTTAFGRVAKLLPKPIQNFFEQNSLGVSKSVNALNYLLKSVNSFMSNHAFDALGRLMHVLFVPLSKLEDIFLVGGLSSGLTQMWLAVNRGKSNDPMPKSAFEDLQYHFMKIKSLFVDLFKPGGHKLLWQNLSNDKGAPHLLVLTGIGNVLSPIIGVGSRLLGLPQGIVGFCRKVAGVLRNLMSILSDIGKWLDPDKLVKSVGATYLGVSALDISQTFISDPEAKTTVNHFLQPVTNFANYLYAKVSSKKADEAKAK